MIWLQTDVIYPRNCQLIFDTFIARLGDYKVAMIAVVLYYQSFPSMSNIFHITKSNTPVMYAATPHIFSDAANFCNDILSIRSFLLFQLYAEG